MSGDRAAGLRHVLEFGFRASLSPLGFVPNRDSRTWVRIGEEVHHVVSLLKRRDSYDVQWGLVCPELVDVMWGVPHSSFDVGQAIVTGTPSTIRHPARAQSFNAASLDNAEALAAGVREDMAVVSSWMQPFTTRAAVREYLMANREPTDRRAFVVPAKLPLKLLTAAALAVADRDQHGCALLSEAEAALAPFKGDITRDRLARVRQMAAGLCG